MARIRYLNFFDILNLKKLVSHLTTEKFFDYTCEFISHPLAMVNYALPLSMKYAPDSYVAIQDGELKGMLSLKIKKNNPLKCRITKLLLDKNAYEIGEQLINYTVSRYGAKGVETIEVIINSEENDMIDLFSKSCGFRYCLDYQLYKINPENYTQNHVLPENFIFRPFKESDVKSVAELYNQNILPYYKFPLSKNTREFSDSIFKGLSQKTTFKFIFEDKYLKQVRGFLNVETSNNNDYLINFIILPSYENYLKEMLSFAVSQIAKRTTAYNLYFMNNKFQCNAGEFEKFLKENNEELIRTDMIFVKDFFKQIKSDEAFIKPAIIYNEINGKPVFKI